MGEIAKTIFVPLFSKNVSKEFQNCSSVTNSRASWFVNNSPHFRNSSATADAYSADIPYFQM